MKQDSTFLRTIEMVLLVLMLAGCSSFGPLPLRFEPTSFPTIAILPENATRSPTQTSIVITPTQGPTFVLPTPNPGTGSATGRVLCEGKPLASHTVYFLSFGPQSYSIVTTTTTDELGKFFINNLHPTEYAVWGVEPSKSINKEGAFLRPVMAGQNTDFGDFPLADSACHPVLDTP